VGNTQARRGQSRGTYDVCRCACVYVRAVADMCVCVRAFTDEEREIATYRSLVRPENWVGDRVSSWLPNRKRYLWETHTSRERARAYACQPIRVSAGPCARVTQAAVACHSRALRMRVCAGPVRARVHACRIGFRG